MSKCERCGHDFGDPSTAWTMHACSTDCIAHMRQEIERLRPVAEAAIEYVQHQLSASLAGVPPLTESARTERRMELRRALHREVDRYLAAKAGGDDE